MDGFKRLDRRFQLWGYSVSMGQLLLRSNRSNSVETRVDAYFQNVQQVDLPTSMEGLVIDGPDGDRFDMRGSGWQGYVVAGVMEVAEDEGAYHDPSSTRWVGGLGTESTT